MAADFFPNGYFDPDYWGEGYFQADVAGSISASLSGAGALSGTGVVSGQTARPGAGVGNRWIRQGQTVRVTERKKKKPPIAALEAALRTAPMPAIQAAAEKYEDDDIEIVLLLAA